MIQWQKKWNKNTHVASGALFSLQREMISILCDKLQFSTNFCVKRCDLKKFWNLLNWNFPHFSPCETGGRKAREISICRRHGSQGSCSYFDFPLVFDTFRKRINHLLVSQFLNALPKQYLVSGCFLGNSSKNSSIGPIHSRNCY